MSEAVLNVLLKSPSALASKGRRRRERRTGRRSRRTAGRSPPRREERLSRLMWEGPS